MSDADWEWSLPLDPQDEARHFLREMLVEFLRAVSANDTNGRAHKVDYAFWKAINALGNVGSDQRTKVSEAAFSEAIAEASARTYDDERGVDRVATAAGKVLAERIAGTGTQHRLAHGRLNDALRSWRDEMDAVRRSAARGVY